MRWILLLSHRPPIFFITLGFYRINTNALWLLFSIRKQIKKYYILYVPALDLDAAEQVAHIQHIVPITDEQMPFEVVKNTIGNLGSTAGVEAKALTLSRYLELTNALNVQVKDI